MGMEKNPKSNKDNPEIFRVLYSAGSETAAGDLGGEDDISFGTPALTSA